MKLRYTDGLRIRLAFDLAVAGEANTQHQQIHK